MPEIVLEPKGTDLAQLRRLYNMKANTLVSKDAAGKLTAFFFWSAWAAVTHRAKDLEDNPVSFVEPNHQLSYTNSRPKEDLVGNHMPADFLWRTLVSVCLLLVGIGCLGYWYFTNHEEVLEPPEQDPFMGLVITPSMRSLEKWVWTAFALTVVNVFCGHYLGHVAIGASFSALEVVPFTNLLSE